MNSILEVSGLYKSYKNIPAVDGITFNVKKGEMFGLVGPDGAGKTSVIRILCGLCDYDRGNISILGMSIEKEKKKIQHSIGYLSQKFSLYGDLSVDENIEFFAEIHDVRNYKERRNELLRFTRLIDFRDRLADKLSGGMKQKLALSCSLIHKPKILFLDEPTTGVDPISRRDFWKILSSLTKEGITIVMTTPYLDEAERCNRLAMMNKGKIISLDEPQAIKASINKEVFEVICSSIKKAYEIIKSKTAVEVQMFGDRLNLVTENYKKEIENIKTLLEEENINIISHRPITPSLENVFIYKIREAN